jgi:hypothetical protein
MATDTLNLDPVDVTASAPTPSRGEPPPPDTEELVIVTGGQRLSGWTSVRVVAGAEIFPSVAVNHRYLLHQDSAPKKAQLLNA